MKASPYSMYLETSLLHSMIVGGPHVIDAVYTKIRGDLEHFYNEHHRTVYDTLLTMYKANTDINSLTVHERLKSRFQTLKLLKIIMDKVYQGEILQDVHEPCMQLLDYSIKRRLMQLGHDVINAVDGHEHIGGMDLLGKTSSKISNLIDHHVPDTQQDMGVISVAAAKMMKDAMRFRSLGEFPGVPTGFYELDGMVGGFKPGELIIGAGRPGMGKTAFILSAALNASKKYPVAIFSLEMNKEMLLLRLGSQYSKVPLEKILHGDTTDAEYDKVVSSLKEIEDNYKIILDDDPDLDIVLLKAKLRRYINKFGVKIVFIDYLQLMRSPTAQSREREVALISRELKIIAREFKIPVIVLAQLNRDVEHRPDKIPMLSDLRESGSLEQDSDVVLFLYRPEYYGIMSYPNGTPTSNTCQVIVAKQRNGRVGPVLLTYVKEYTGFFNYIAPGILPATNHQPFEEEVDF